MLFFDFKIKTGVHMSNSWAQSALVYVKEISFSKIRDREGISVSANFFRSESRSAIARKLGNPVDRHHCQSSRKMGRIVIA